MDARSTARRLKYTGVLCLIVCLMSLAASPSASAVNDKSKPKENDKFDVVVVSGSSVAFGSLESGLTGYQASGTTQLQVDTGSKSWRIVATLSGDPNGFSSGSTVEAKVNDARGWVALGTSGPADITGELTDKDKGIVLTVSYRVTTGWTSPPIPYNLEITYTAEPYL